MLLNLAEGQRFNKGNKLRHYEIAQGSANEIRGALDATEGWGYIEQLTEARALLDRLRAAVEADKFAQAPTATQGQSRETSASKLRFARSMFVVE